MKENEKRLLRVLVFIIIAVILYLVLFFNVSAISDSKKTITKYEKAIQNMKSSGEPEKSGVKENDVIEIEKLPISEVATLILTNLENCNVEIENYTFHEDSKQSYVDFKVKCSSKEFIDYISSFKNTTFPYTVINCIFSTQPGYIKGNLRYSNDPCVIRKEDKLLYTTQLNKHFPKIIDSVTILPIQKDDIVIEESVEDGSDKYLYLGKITENNQKLLLFKTIETGKIFKVDISMVEIQEDYIIVKINNIRYKIFI